MVRLLVYSSVSCVVTFFFFSSGFECSDLQGYLTHPGFSQFDIFRVDGLLYYLLYTIGDARIWYSLIQILTISIWWLAAFTASASAFTLCQLQIFPWFLSIIGVHYWMCGVRSGLSTSLLFFCLSLRLRCDLHSSQYRDISAERPTLASIALFLLVLLSFFVHWTSAILAPLIVWPDQIGKSIRSLARLIRGRLNWSFLLTLASLTFFAAIFLFAFSSRALFYLDSGSVFPVSHGGAIGDGYGRYYGYVSLFLIVFCVIYFRSLIIGNNLLLGLFLLSSFSCLLPAFGFSGHFIRLQLPLVSAFFYSLIVLAPARPLLLFLISAPYSVFTIRSLLSYF